MYFLKVQTTFSLLPQFVVSIMKSNVHYTAVKCLFRTRSYFRARLRLARKTRPRTDKSHFSAFDENNYCTKYNGENLKH